MVEAIRTHLPAGRPESVEGIALRDADILEQLGAIGILRTVSKVGRDTRYHTFTEAIAALRRALASLPAQLRTGAAQALAAPKIAILEAFLDAVEGEAGKSLF